MSAAPQQKLFTAEMAGRKQRAASPAQPSENPMPYLRHILCVIVLAWTAVTQSGGVPASQPVNPAGGETLEGLARSEVRLRKLHLVRPDLIPYPIAYDVYC